MKKQASHSTSVSPERGRQIEKRCLAYVLAAGGTALVTAPAKAEIVYTPTHKVVDTPGSLMVDLNNDGISDLELDDFSVVASSYGNIKQLGIRGAQNPLARVIGKKAGFPFFKWCRLSCTVRFLDWAEHAKELPWPVTYCERPGHGWREIFRRLRA